MRLARGVCITFSWDCSFSEIPPGLSKDELQKKYTTSYVFYLDENLKVSTQAFSFGTKSQFILNVLVILACLKSWAWESFGYSVLKGEIT